MEIKNKKGWLRVVEVTLAIVLIVGAVFIFYSKTDAVKSNDVQEQVYQHFEEVFSNQTLRDKIYNVDFSNLDEVHQVENETSIQIMQRLVRRDFEIRTELCKATEECRLTPDSKSKEIYSLTELVSTDSLGIGKQANGVPIKVKIYIIRV